MTASLSSASQNLPLVSVIVPCHNYGHFLGKAIESVRGQTYPHWECIIVDDGSTDNTRQVALSYQSDSRIRYIHQDQRGVSTARNTGIVESTGKYLQFLDADDLLEPGKLLAQVDYLEANPCVDLVYGNSVYFYEEGGSAAVDIAKRLPFPRVCERGEKLLAALIKRNIMVVSAPLIRRADGGAELFNPDLHRHEDWEYWIRLASRDRSFHFLSANNTRALIRIHAGSTVQSEEPMLLSNLTVRRGLHMQGMSRLLCQANRRRIGVQLAKLAKFESRRGKYRAALGYAAAALRETHFHLMTIGYLLIPQSLITWGAMTFERLFRSRHARNDSSSTDR